MSTATAYKSVVVQNIEAKQKRDAIHFAAAMAILTVLGVVSSGMLLIATYLMGQFALAGVAFAGIVVCIGAMLFVIPRTVKAVKKD